jgi:hypothetical protein
MQTTPQVLLVTDHDHPAGEPGAEHLVRALDQEGLTSAWAAWDDPYVDWAGADVVAVRSVHDHVARCADFLGWAGFVGPRLLNGVAAFRWARGGGCPADLERAGVPVAPAGVATVASVLVLGGRPYGPSLARESALLGVDAVAAAAEVVGTALVCTRVGLAKHRGRLAVGDVDVVSPALGLDRDPAAAAAFADVVGGLVVTP